MEPTLSSLVPCLLDPDSRRELFDAIKAEQGAFPPTINTIGELASRVRCDIREFRELKEALLSDPDEGERVLGLFIHNPSFPEQILFELSEAGKCITHLAHRKGPIALLLKIARENPGHSEALQTIGQGYFQSEETSVDEFQSFMDEFGASYGLLKSLCYLQGIPDGKREILLTAIRKSDAAPELAALYEELRIEAKLLATVDVAYIQEMYRSKSPRFLRAISANAVTPIGILNELAESKGFQFAGVIRNQALGNLRKREA